LDAVPATPKVICLYIAFLANFRSPTTHKKLEFSTVTNYVASLSSLHVQRGIQPPDLNHHQIIAAIAGLRRNRKEHPQWKSGIIPQHLTAIHSSLHLVPSNKRQVFWTGCLLLFYSMLRRSNLFFDRGHKSHLTRADVKPSSQGTMLNVKSIKNTRFENVRFDVYLPRVSNSPLCPSRALGDLLKTTAGAPQSTPILSFVGSHKTVIPLDATDFTRIFRSRLGRNGFPGKDFSIHSFRRGSATFASATGISNDVIKTQGAWHSDCYEEYVDQDSERRQAFAKSMGQAVGNYRTFR
jgi:hypothetical protein